MHVELADLITAELDNGNQFVLLDLCPFIRVLDDLIMFCVLVCSGSSLGSRG